MIFRAGSIAILIAGASAATLEAQAGSGGQDGAPARTIFEGATVIDGTGAAARADMAIVVEGEAISAVVRAGELGQELRDGAEIVDASGWFAIPGLIESHTHVATQASRARAEFILNRQLYAGITTARDMAGDVRSLMDLRRASLVKEIDAPDLHFSVLMAGPAFFTDPRTVSSAAGETPGSVSWMQAVTAETDLAEAVALARGTWATGIKTYAAIDGDLLAAIAAEAARQGIPVWSHTHVGPARALEVARAGVRSMSHVCDIGSAAIPDDVFREGQEGRRAGFVDVDLSDPAVDSVFAVMRRNRTVLDATIRVFVEVGQARMAAIDTVNARRPAEAPDSAQEPQGPRRPPIDRRRRGVRPRCGTEEAVELTRRAYEAGVMVAAGTDGMAPPASDFPALHDEIRLLHEDVGMHMVDALMAASYHGAVALGMEDEIGTIEPGKQANIVFLREDPLAGPESLRSVELTVKRGAFYYRRDFVLGAPPDPPGRLAFSLHRPAGQLFQPHSSPTSPSWDMMNERTAVQEVADRIDRLDERIASAFKPAIDRISAIESRLNARLDELERQAGRWAAALGNRLDGTAVGFKQTSYQLDVMETRISKRIDAIEGQVRKRISALESKVDAVGRHFSDT